jgi:nucleobase:cation symporter-1, NCS1 family
MQADPGYVSFLRYSYSLTMHASQLVDFSRSATIMTRLHDIIAVKRTQEDETDACSRYGKWSNIDLEPTPPQQRNWSPWYYFAFQFSIAFSPTTYNIGSTLFSIGLTWWTIIIASFVGTLLCCFVIFFNARGPTYYHVG